MSHRQEQATEPRSKPKAIGYIRVSTAEQVNGFGLEVQERAIRDYARRSGIRLVRIDRDEGLSGSNGLDTRAGLASALATLEARGADVLLVMKLDRLARDLVLQETIIGQLRRVGGHVVSVTEPEMEGEDHTRDLVRQVLGAISQYERAVIRSRMASGKAAKARKGGYVGGRPPFGYVAAGGSLVPHPQEQKVIRLAKKLRGQGASYREIARQLEDAGHHPKSGATWAPAQVARITAQTPGPASSR